jgi:hypothetical protein
MKRLLIVTVVSVAALGMSAGRASAWHSCGCCGCTSMKFCCVQPNAFSPFCCSPAPSCGCCPGAPIYFCGNCSMPCGCGGYPQVPAQGGCGYGGCGYGGAGYPGYGGCGYDGGYGAPAMAPSAPMPPASGGSYTPPMPMPAANGQTYGPPMPMPMPNGQSYAPLPYPSVQPAGFGGPNGYNMMVPYNSGMQSGQGMYFGNLPR